MLIKNFENFNNICKLYSIKNYVVNIDDTISVYGSVYLNDLGLTSIPIKFRYVSGNFNCMSNRLTSLVGCPEFVDGDFNCRMNLLDSLVGGPKIVGGNFYCSNNRISTLKGCPFEIGGSFDCSNNNLTNDDFFCDNYYGRINCSHNKICDINKFQKNTQDIIIAVNPIYDIVSLFRSQKNFYRSLDYDYIRNDKIIVSRFKEALDEYNIKLPSAVNGYEYV